MLEDVPVFVEHTTRARDGRLLTFDRANLAKVVAACNRRIEDTGDYAAITIGHTADPELVRQGKASNPPVVGFAGPFRLGRIGPPGRQKWAILARFRIFREDWPRVKKYPRRSPELWLMPSYDEMFLDPIALLGAETPRLDMGLLYQAQLHPGRPVLVEKYAAAAPSAANVFLPAHGQPKERYADQGGNAMPSIAEIVDAVLEALEGLDWVQAAKALAAEQKKPQEPPEAEGEEDQPESTPVEEDQPKLTPVTEPPPPPPPVDPSASPPADRQDKPKQAYAAELAGLLAQALAPLSAKLDRMEQQLGSDRRKVRDLERYSRLQALARQGYAIDPDRIWADLSAKSISDEEFERHLALLKQNTARAPVDLPLPVPDREPYSAGAARQPTSEQRSLAKVLCEKAALEGKRPDYAATLHAVMQGKRQVVLVD